MTQSNWQHIVGLQPTIIFIVIVYKSSENGENVNLENTKAQDDVLKSLV